MLTLTKWQKYLFTHQIVNKYLLLLRMWNNHGFYALTVDWDLTLHLAKFYVCVSYSWTNKYLKTKNIIPRSMSKHIEWICTQKAFIEMFTTVLITVVQHQNQLISFNTLDQDDILFWKYLIMYILGFVDEKILLHLNCFVLYHKSSHP